MQGKYILLFFLLFIIFFCSRKRALAHISRASERYLSDDPKMVADIEELELEYLFKYVFI
jgi:hypothetical protein